MEERKNNIGYVVAITVLVMLVLGMGAFIIYDKVINKTNETNIIENNNENITYRDFNLQEAQKLVDKYFIYYYGEPSFDNMSDEDKFLITYYQIDEKDLKPVSCKSLYGVEVYFIENSLFGCQGTVEAFDYNFLNNIYHKLFGSNNDLPKVTMHERGYIDYVSNTNQFAILDSFGSGSNFPTEAIYDVLTAKIDNNDTLIIKVGYDSLDVHDPEWDQYISRYDGAIFDKNKLNANYIKQNLDRVYEITFIFEKENDNFVLKSFTKK